MKKAIYGTVYNNANGVRQCLESVYNPDYTICVVDNFSTDGTYEILKELRQEYNIQLYRTSCSRGAGRDYALRHCPDGSFTAYFDLDATYNQNFHLLLETGIDRMLAWQYFSQTTYYARKESALQSGGFSDLLSSDALEFVARTGISTTMPVCIGRNQELQTGSIFGRDRRYMSGVKGIVRALRARTDQVRGEGRSLDYFLQGRRWIYLPVYFAARMVGIPRHAAELDNCDLFAAEALKAMANPAEVGIGNDWVMFPVPDPFIVSMDLDSVFRKSWGFYRKFSPRSDIFTWSNPSWNGRSMSIYAPSLGSVKNCLGRSLFYKLEIVEVTAD
ncbi:MAG: glycosyltransferase [Thermoplasmataceae archaeon]